MKLIDLVNTKQGSDSCMRFSNGNTLPYVQLPHGFASFAPQTDSGRGGWFYNPKDRSFEGIRITRQPCPWLGEQGAVAILPQHETPREEPWTRWSGFDPKKAILKPHYMKYEIQRSRADIELVPTNSGACIRITLKDTSRDNFISVLPVTTPCKFEFDNDVLYGYTECVSKQKPRKNSKVHYVMQFCKGDISEAVFKDESVHLKANKSVVEFKVSTSLISHEQAVLNLEREHTYKDLDDLKAITEGIWEEYLSRIRIKTDNEDIMRTFYSCLYRFFLFPNRAYELDENNEPIHYSQGRDTVVKGYHYTNNGFWDTYRTVYSLLALVDHDEYKNMIDSFINDYENDGWLPRWTATEAKYCMPSTAIDTVLADAAKRGVLSGERLEKALEAMMKHANIPSEDRVFGREGCAEYIRLGYVPNSYHESVNLTLDAAYGDWCIAEISKILGKDDIATEYYKRAKYYKNLFDKETGFMRSRNEAREFRDNFHPERWGLDYTEASAYHTSFAVQHDIEGLCELHGGKEALLKKLDEFFATEPNYLVSGYGNEIHEMTEMAAADWGQCAISNQPSFHIPFMYVYLGEKEKTEYWIEKICREGFSYKDDGFPGDEDNGTTSAWYLFSVMGFYPLTPGKAEYVRFKPLADEVLINGRTVDEII